MTRLIFSFQVKLVKKIFRRLFYTTTILEVMHRTGSNSFGLLWPRFIKSFFVLALFLQVTDLPLLNSHYTRGISKLWLIVHDKLKMHNMNLCWEMQWWKNPRHQKPDAFSVHTKNCMVQKFIGLLFLRFFKNWVSRERNLENGDYPIMRIMVVIGQFHILVMSEEKTKY